MAEIVHKKRVINLLPRKGEGILTQFLSWALTIGRLLVIITETLALSVFLYRFSIDMRLVDLHDKIENASIIVSNFGDSEDKFRDLHTRLAGITSYDKQKDSTLTIMKDIIDMGRGKVTFKSLTITAEKVVLDIQAPSAGTLSAFTNDLKNYPKIANISVDRVENRTSTALVTVGITAALNRQGGNK